jgi:3-oxoacyl-[acyl-carrier-protein] synthase-3
VNLQEPLQPTHPMYSRIVGTGSYLPERVVTNAELERMVDTTDERIR